VLVEHEMGGKSSFEQQHRHGRDGVLVVEEFDKIRFFYHHKESYWVSNQDKKGERERLYACTKQRQHTVFISAARYPARRSRL
jgi:hypothetical protein